jgi:hypothetical protein
MEVAENKADPDTLDALRAAQHVLGALVNPDMNIRADNIYFHAVAAEAKVRAAIAKAQAAAP